MESRDHRKDMALKKKKRNNTDQNNDSLIKKIHFFP